MKTYRHIIESGARGEVVRALEQKIADLPDRCAPALRDLLRAVAEQRGPEAIRDARNLCAEGRVITAAAELACDLARGAASIRVVKRMIRLAQTEDFAWSGAIFRGSVHERETWIGRHRATRRAVLTRLRGAMSVAARDAAEAEEAGR